MLNALTVDVEDFFQVSAFESCIHRDSWDTIPLRVYDNTQRILDLFDEHNVRATFFTLGWVAERAPGLVKKIVSAGHELACHGYGHQRIYTLSPKVFREDVAKAKAILEDLSGVEVKGYRAPSYSITKDSQWALNVLIETGFTYDSSIFPIYHDLYGMPGTRRFPYLIKRESGVIREFPITTYPFSVLGKRLDLPVSGGGYFRLFPFGMVKRALTHVNEKERQPVVVYFHPWEIDPDQPRVAGAGLKSRFRHYVNLGKMFGKIDNLLRTFQFSTMSEVLDSYEFSPDGEERA